MFYKNTILLKIFLTLLLFCSVFLLGNSVLADTQTFYSGTGTGWIDTYGYTPPVNTWSGKHSLSSGASGRSFYNQNNDYGIGLLQGTVYGYIIGRGFVPFDTSALPDVSYMTSGTVKVYVGQAAYMKAGTDARRYLVLVQTSQASTNSLSADDFDQCGTETAPAEGSDHVFVSDGYVGWVTFTLNSTGLSWINKTGYTKFGIRYGWDVENVAPTNEDNEIYFRANGYTGNTYDPRLDLVYITEVCGNGTKEGSEACDDGNLVDGDGCSSLCVIETGHLINMASTTLVAGYFESTAGMANSMMKIMSWWFGIIIYFILLAIILYASIKLLKSMKKRKFFEIVKYDKQQNNIRNYFESPAEKRMLSEIRYLRGLNKSRPMAWFFTPFKRGILALPFVPNFNNRLKKAKATKYN